MDVVPSTAKLKLGYDEINKTRDYILAFGVPATGLPVNKGGTGATTAAQARTNLGITWANLSGKPSSFPPSAHTHDSLSTGPVSFGWNSGLNRWNTNESIAAAAAVFGGDVNVGGHIYVPNSTPASAGYTVAYINNDGRLCRGASARRFKKNIRAARPLVNAFGIPLSEFELRGGDGTRILGYIADDMAEIPDLARFVIHDAKGRVEGIDHIQLLLAQTVQLHAEVQQLRDRVAELEGAR